MADIAFVAGATGYTGRSVVAECVRRGVTTHAHVRPDSSDLRGWQERFGALGAHVDTTPWDQAAMGQRLRALQPTVVFALLGSTRKRAKRENIDKPYATVDMGLTMLLLEAASGVRPLPRFVYLSAMGVRDVKNAYIQARWQVEQRLRRGPVPYVIARPGLIAGDRDEKRTAEDVGYALTRGVSALLDGVGARRWANTVRPLKGAQLALALTQLALAPESNMLVEAHRLVALAHSSSQA